MAKRKLVLEEHEASVLVGIMQDGCDPVIRTVEGTLEDALNYVPKFLGEANEEWAVSPKKPTYTPPAAPKPAPAAAGATPDLPLLSGTGTEQPAEAKVEEQVGGFISKDEAIKIAEEQGGSREELEAAAEEKVTEAEAEVTEPPAAPAEIEPESAPVPTEPSAAAKPGEWEYYLQDGRGPFKTVQLAMDALGLDANNRPQHNRWDRLSTDLKEKIQHRPKA